MTMAVCFLTPIYTPSAKRPLISDHIKGPLVAAFKSPLMKALDRSFETLGLWIVTSSVTFIRSINQSGIKPCLIVHLVAVWTLIYAIFKSSTSIEYSQDNKIAQVKILINLLVLVNTTLHWKSCYLVTI